MTDHKRPVRKGKKFLDRPTEWSTAIIMLALAVQQYAADHNVAALVATIGACLPVLITAAVSWYESRKADTVAVVEAVDEDN